MGGIIYLRGKGKQIKKTRKEETKMKYNVKQIMQAAWGMAKQWASAKGGKAIEYIAAAMKHAWRVAKMDYAHKNGLTGLDGNKMYLTGSNRQPMYLAVITGLNDKFGLNRKFVSSPKRGTENFEFELKENTFYNWKETTEQFFGHFVNGKMVPMTQEDIKKAIA